MIEERNIMECGGRTSGGDTAFPERAPNPKAVSTLCSATALHMETEASLRASLPAEVKAEVAVLEGGFRMITEMPKVGHGLEAMAQRHLGKTGFSFPALKTKYRNWMNAGRDWAALVNKAKVPDFAARLQVAREWTTGGVGAPGRGTRPTGGRGSDSFATACDASRRARTARARPGSPATRRSPLLFPRARSWCANG